MSSEVIQDLSFLSLKELQMILQSFNDDYDSDYHNTLKYMIKCYTDKDVIAYLKPVRLVNKDKRSQEEKIAELRSYYKLSILEDKGGVIHIDKRGRKKQDRTLKDDLFELFDTKGAMIYSECINNGLILSENTYKTLCSQWRQARGIKLKRGRKGSNTKS